MVDNNLNNDHDNNEYFSFTKIKLSDGSDFYFIYDKNSSLNEYQIKKLTDFAEEILKSHEYSKADFQNYILVGDDLAPSVSPSYSNHNYFEKIIGKAENNHENNSKPFLRVNLSYICNIEKKEYYEGIVSHEATHIEKKHHLIHRIYYPQDYKNTYIKEIQDIIKSGNPNDDAKINQTINSLKTNFDNNLDNLKTFLQTNGVDLNKNDRLEFYNKILKNDDTREKFLEYIDISNESLFLYKLISNSYYFQNKDKGTFQALNNHPEIQKITMIASQACEVQADLDTYKKASAYNYFKSYQGNEKFEGSDRHLSAEERTINLEKEIKNAIENYNKSNDELSKEEWKELISTLSVSSWDIKNKNGKNNITLYSSSSQFYINNANIKNELAKFLVEEMNSSNGGIDNKEWNKILELFGNNSDITLKPEANGTHTLHAPNWGLTINNIKILR